MPLASFIESTKNHEADRTEGGLFLCESDLLSALNHTQSVAGSQPPGKPASEASGVLLSLKGQLAVGAC